MAVWTNADGLNVRFGPDEAEGGKGGEYRTHTSTRMVEFEVDFDDFAAFGNSTILSETVFIPNGVLLEKAEVVVLTPFASGGAATMHVGLVKLDGSAYDIDGIDAGIALAALTPAGKKTAADGALVTTVLDNGTDDPSLVAVQANVANYTAGKALIRIWYTHFQA